MLKVRTTKLSSGNTAIQVVHRHNHKTEIVKHIGTARNEIEKQKLLTLANEYIATNSVMPPLIPQAFKQEEEKIVIALDQIEITARYYHFAYEFLSYFYRYCGFTTIPNPLLRDLAFMRIIEPSSKLQAVSLLKDYFGISYPINTVYEQLTGMKALQTEIEKIAVHFAKEYLSFDFALVFYDVTTLYFETFKADEDATDAQGVTSKGLRKTGFSKDNKPQQPQILIGLLVTKEGYPVGIDMFEGNTFEGKTVIPTIQRFQKQYEIQTLTVVADAGMLSLDTIKELKEAELSYIVGARMKSISQTTMKEISDKLNKTDGAIYKILNTNYGTLITTYSGTRAAKDKSDRNKQIERAKKQLEHPGTIARKARFIAETTKSNYELNEELMKEDELMDGIKGYYTNVTDVTDELVMSRYKELWHVEKAFRIAKSDLEARPIFHHKKEAIVAHMLIVFVSLCLTKAIEIKTKNSIKRVKEMIWKILDIEIVDTLTKRTFTKRMETRGNPMAELFEALNNVDNNQKRVLKK